MAALRSFDQDCRGVLLRLLGRDLEIALETEAGNHIFCAVGISVERLSTPVFDCGSWSASPAADLLASPGWIPCSAQMTAAPAPRSGADHAC